MSAQREVMFEVCRCWKQLRIMPIAIAALCSTLQCRWTIYNPIAKKTTCLISTSVRSRPELQVEAE